MVVDTDLVRARMNALSGVGQVVNAEIHPPVVEEGAPVVEDAGGFSSETNEVAEVAAPVKNPKEVPDQVAGQEDTLVLNNMSIKKVLCMHG